MKGLSIVIPTNNTEYIEETIKSIGQQTYLTDVRKYEIMVGVDGCKECLQDLLQMYQEEPHNFFIYNYEKNMGTYLTLNSLIKEAYYDDIMIFGADDIMLPHMVETIYKQKGKADIVQYYYSQITTKGNKNILSEPKHTAAGAIWLKKYVWNRLGGFKPWRYSADSEFLERAKSANYKIKIIPEELFIYRMWDNNLTSTVPTQERIKQRSQIKFNGYSKDEIKINTEYNEGYLFPM